MANVLSPSMSWQLARNQSEHHYGLPTFGSSLTSLPTPPTAGDIGFVKPSKRKADRDSSEEFEREESMGRTPPPDRIKKSAPKRLRASPEALSAGPDAQRLKRLEKSRQTDNEMDVGLLLATLPTETLLPLLVSLISENPALKSTLLKKIPRPSADKVLEAFATHSRKLRDAYPYSSGNASRSMASASTTGFGFGSALPRQTNFSAQTSSFGFGTMSSFGSTASASHPTAPSEGEDHMREEYIRSRIASHVTSFASTATSYLPFYSLLPASESRSIPPHLIHSRPHPNETFTVLAALTSHMMEQPPLTQSELQKALMPRLESEWTAWLDRVDATVNQEGGMYGGETVRRWERQLDSFASAKTPGWERLRDLRNNFVAKVGWLVGRTGQNSMMEDM